MPTKTETLYNLNDLEYKFYERSLDGTIGGTVVAQKAPQYSDLTDGEEVGDMAYVNQSEGTPWLPGTVGGTYYPAGWYLWNGTAWISDRNNITNQLQLNTQGLADKADVNHTHVKADITDFNDGDYAPVSHQHVKSHITDFNEADYATAAQGTKADNALPKAGGTITGDLEVAGFLTLDGESVREAFNEKLLSSYYSELTYTSGNLTKIEYWDSSSKNTKYYTKDLTYNGAGNLTQTVLTNNNTSDTQTKVLTYDGSGNLIYITKS